MQNQKDIHSSHDDTNISNEYSLVVYPGSDNLETVITKTNGLNQKSGPFDITLFLGDVLPELSESGIPNVKIEHPIYFTSGSSSITGLTPVDGNKSRELTSNFSYLGDFGIYVFSNGIRLAYITGDESVLDSNFEKIKASLQSTKEIDILITFQWPKLLAQEAKLFLGNSKIDEIVKLIRPKYHFATGSSSGKFSERAPFQWDDGTITRFISLSKFGSKEKWIYAFNYSNDDQTQLKSELPKNLAKNPFDNLEASNIQPEVGNTVGSKKRKAEEDLPQAEDQVQSLKEKKQFVSKRPVVLPENCFFCLSNPKLQTHMIISIGEHAYLTIAKGPLTKPTERMKFSGHCLIIPIAHVPKLEIQKDEKNQLLLNEVMRYEVSLVKFFASFNLGTVLFQINKSNSVHFHIQVFPIPVDFLTDFDKNLQKNAKLNNTKYERNVKLNFTKFAEETDPKYLEMINSDKDYISFTVFNKSIEDKLIYISEIETLDKQLDLQFGRRVLAYLLQVPKRIKWDKCQQSTQKETEETGSFKEAYKEYDFTMDI